MSAASVLAKSSLCTVLLCVAGADTASAQSAEWNALEDEAVTLLSRYLQLDTTNPPGNEIRGAEFFRELFAAEGIDVQVHESAPGRGNVVARLAGDGSAPAVVLLNHLDVVPADARFWSRDPYGGEIVDGEIWGRGALDMKGTAVAQAMVMVALARRALPHPGDVVFVGSADEEAGGAMGVGYLWEEHPEIFENAGVVLNEGGWIAVDPAGEVAFYGVEAAQKVPFWLRLVATGTPGHGSMPRPDAATHRLAAALGRIAAHQTELRVVPEVQRFFADTAERAPEALREALRDLRASLQDPAFAAAFTRNPRQNAQVRDTISLTVLGASSKTNVIPPEAVAELDVRLLPDRDPEDFLAELRRVIDDDSIRIEVLLSFRPSSSPSDHELFDVLREIAARRHPGAVVTTPLAVGFTDCHFFRERDVPCYGFVPFQVGEAEIPLVHGNDERISVENLRRGTRILYKIVARLAGAELRDPLGDSVAQRPGDVQR